MVKISPSILAADFANLAAEVQALEAAGADMIHIDVMDGHFVPNLTFGPNIIDAIRKYTNLPLDVHLMVTNPEQLLFRYIQAGADIITIHPESTTHLDDLLNKIRQANIRTGVALLPSTSFDSLTYIIDKVDMILVMSVNPGFGGQQFLASQYPKIRHIAQQIANSDILLAVDGGINDITAPACIQLGADILVAGSYIFSGNYQQRINQLRSIT
jgi:ribulose-phosphate 3-epimerase